MGDSGFLPLAVDFVFWTLVADLGFLPLDADLGFLTLVADIGFWPLVVFLEFGYKWPILDFVAEFGH